MKTWWKVPKPDRQEEHRSLLIETGPSSPHAWIQTSANRSWILQFDVEWYLQQYPEVEILIESGNFKDALDHFVGRGASEGRRPNVGFDEAWYRVRYEDVAEGVRNTSFSCGFQHFIVYGFMEGRQANSLPIDEAWYRQTYQDVDRALGAGEFPSAHSHYTVIGTQEQRDPNPAFSETWYRRFHPSADRCVRKRSVLCGYEFFLEHGEKLGHKPHPRFDEEYYRQANPDVRIGIWERSWRSGYQHLITHGLQEKRTWRTRSPIRESQMAIRRVSRTNLQDLFGSSRRVRFDYTSEPEVSVILVLHNQAELTLACLESLRSSESVSIEVVVVDNASSDLTSEVFARVDGVTLMRNEVNEGFIRGANRGARAATAPRLLFLNNDAVIRQRAIRSAVDRLESAAYIGAVGGRVVLSDGRLQEAGSVVWNDGTVEPWGQGDDPTSGSYTFARTTDYCTGAFLLVRRDAFYRLGGFREDFLPAYYEDVDLCFRLRSELGLETVYEPAAVVHHFVSASDSGRGQQSEDLTRANRVKFVRLNERALRSQSDWGSSTLFEASDRARRRPCVLVIDDFVPLDTFGSGCPRMREIVSALVGLGYFVTMFATNPSEHLDPSQLDGLPSHDLEIVSHLARPGFEDFWKRRTRSYSHVIVSRPHNMLWLESLDIDLTPARVIYDAEAFVSPRVERQAEILDLLPEGVSAINAEEEKRLCNLADAVWVVSAREAEMLAPEKPFWVVGHAENLDPGEGSFNARSGIVFVGRIHEQGSPNVDGLSWFLDNVFARASSKLGAQIPLSVIGLRGDVDFPELPGVCYMDTIDDLRPLLHASRVFVAPARFAAGIPLKIVTASAYGLPTVASSILVRQLGWKSGFEIADGGQDDGEKFATELVRLYSDEKLWRTVRNGALHRTKTEYGREGIRKSIQESLIPTPKDMESD